MRKRAWSAFFRVAALLADVAHVCAAAVAFLDHHWVIGALLACSYALITFNVPWCPVEPAYWLLAGAMLIAWRQGATDVFFLAAPRGLLRSLTTLIVVTYRFSGPEVAAFFARPQPGYRLAAALAFWRRRGRIAHAAAFALAFTIGLGWSLGIFWAAYHWSSGWRLPYEIAAGAVLYLAVGLAPHAVGLATPRPPDIYGTSGNMALRSRSWGETSSTAGWASDAIHTHVEPLGTSWTPDFGTGFTGPLDPRLRLFAADCAQHLLKTAQVAGARRDRQAARNVNRAKIRAEGRLPAWLLALYVARARERRAVESRADRRAGSADDAACAAFHAMAAPTPVSAANAASNCCLVTVSGTIRAEEQSWQSERLDWYRRQAPAAG
jgi:hypothetical protein